MGAEYITVLFNSNKIKGNYEEEMVSPEKLKEVITKLGYLVLDMKS